VERIRLHPDFVDTIAQTGLSLAAFCRQAGVSTATIHALRNPTQHPHRKGGMQRATAWKLAKTYAQLAQVSDQVAWDRLLVVEQVADDA
jgi:lambda repressor-like predicted transcriptional regulator